MRPDRFDYAGERAYYSSSITELRDWKWMSKDARHWIPGFPQVFANKSVLDIGAGECLLTFAIAETSLAKRVVALELILHRMSAARQVNLRGLGLVCGDCFRLPFPAESFGVVVGNGVLHHLPDEDAAVREVSRVLGPGGLYFGREPNFHNLVVKQRVLGGHHTLNEHAIWPEKIRSVFSQHDLQVRVTPFWRRLPWLHHPWLSVSVAIMATKVA
jgi:ubiquinone/menaquinone biosynthesis C-methylase UbiE